MSKNTKIILAVLIGLIVAGGIAVGIYAGVEGFGSSDSDDDDDDDGDSASNECGQCWTPECSASAGSGKCEKSTVTITDQSGSNRFKISTNAYPCHEMRGTNIYASCPVPNSESETFPVPDLCSDGKYHDGGSCGTYNYLTV